jgi:hypothetical protein
MVGYATAIPLVGIIAGLAKIAFASYKYYQYRRLNHACQDEIADGARDIRIIFLRGLTEVCGLGLPWIVYDVYKIYQRWKAQPQGITQPKAATIVAQPKAATSI